MSARYYTKNLGGAVKVEALLSLAGANHGTNTAYFCSQAACVEMRPNSSFLTALNKTDETAGATRDGTWWSSCLKHSQLHEDATVYGQYEAFIQ